MKSNKETSVLDFFLDFFIGLIEGGIDFIDSLFSDKDHRVNSEFGKPKDMLRTKHRGISLDGKRAISQKQSFEGVAIFGQTGSGKSTVVQINTLIREQTDNISILCNDPSKEIFLATASTMLDKGYEVKVIDLSDYKRSSGMNLFPKENDTTLISKLVSTAFRSEFGSGKKDFWYLSGEILMTLLAELTMSLPEENRHLPQLTSLLEEFSGNPKEFDSFVAKHAPNERIFKTYRSIIQQPPKQLQGVIANCRAALKTIQNDQNISKILAHREIEWKDMRTKKTIIYVQNSISSQDYISSISNLIFTSFFESVFSELPKKEDLGIYVLLDESSSLNLGPDFSNYCANVRKFNVNITTFWQSPEQISGVYGKEKAQAILANQRTKLWITAGMELKAATELQNALGQYEFEEVTGSNHWKKRHLKTSTELTQMEPNKGIIQYGHFQPIEVKLHKFFEIRKHRKLAERPAPIMTGTVPNREVALFDIKR